MASKPWFYFVLRCRGCGELTNVYPRQNTLTDPSKYSNIFEVGQFVFCPKCESTTWQDCMEVWIPSKGVIARPKHLDFLVHFSGYETK